MKKGFTLIELLAVIVILAIIALIATPIILGIINDAREESNERSVELYASAVRNAIASYQLTGTKAPTKFSDLYIQYDGKVECETEELYEDGSFYIADCTVNGAAVEYTYGEKQETQPTRYYYFGDDWNGTVGSTDAPVEAERLTVSPTDKNFYLGYEVDENNKVSVAYVCFKIEENGPEYCLKGTTDGSAFDVNKTVLEEAFGSSAFSCDDDYSQCYADGFSVKTRPDGKVSASASVGYVVCTVTGSFACPEP